MAKGSGTAPANQDVMEIAVAVRERENCAIANVTEAYLARINKFSMFILVDLEFTI